MEYPSTNIAGNDGMHMLIYVLFVAIMRAGGLMMAGMWALYAVIELRLIGLL